MKMAPSRMMRAIRVHKFGGPEVLKLDENVPVPAVAEKQVEYFYEISPNKIEASLF